MTGEDSKLIGQVRQLINRPDGSQVKIEAERQSWLGIGYRPHNHVAVYSRQTPQHPWKHCDNVPAPGFKSMSRAEYLERGRSALWRTVSFAEVAKVTQLLGKPMASLGSEADIEAANAIAREAMAHAPIDWAALEADAAQDADGEVGESQAAERPRGG